MKKIFLAFVAFVAFVALVCLGSFAKANEVALTLENDIFGGTDRHYTHGTRISFIQESYVGEKLDALSDVLFGELKADFVSLSLAQYMYSPSDITISELMENDRPYGGWLYLAATLFSRDQVEIDILELETGIIGPYSYSDDTQKFIHSLIDSPEPMGWEHQVDSNIGINMVYHKKYRFRYRDAIDYIPYYGACVGNVHTYLNTGSMFRLGHNIPDDFGVYRIEPTIRALSSIGYYGFMDVNARYVAYNVFLDGHGNSHRVNKENFVGDLDFGAGIKVANLEFIYGYNIRTKEFKDQEEFNRFGTLIFSWEY